MRIQMSFVCRPVLRVCGLGLLAAMLTGCGGPAGGGGSLLASGGGCKEWRSEMNRLVNRGVVQKTEAAAAGRKLTPTAKADVDRYNALLERYLGSNCASQ